jgi:hypothetical protein
MLWWCTFAIGGAFAFGPGYANMPIEAAILARVAFSFVIACWVIEDARKRDRPLCHDYDSLVCFFPPIFVPIYLFQTRGLKAFLTLFGGIVIVSLGATLGWVTVFFIQKMS